MRTAVTINPRTLKDALKARAMKDVVCVAGGTDVLVKLHDVIDRPWPRLLVLDGVDSLRRISTGKKLELGPLVTFAEIAGSSALKLVAPQLVQAAGLASSPPIRNRATVGGNLANGSPSGDLIPPLYVLGAVLELSSPRGRRRVKVEDFFTGPGATVLRRDELITSIVFDKSGGSGFFNRLAVRRALAVSKVSVAADLTIRKNTVELVRIALGAVAPTVIRAVRTEELLAGRRLDAATIAAACDLIKSEARPIDDIRSTAEYRREMAGVLLRRGLEEIARSS
jgi:CO/xanthine dehydrogenase FAD-binding subunit